MEELKKFLTKLLAKAKFESQQEKDEFIVRYVLALYMDTLQIYYAKEPEKWSELLKQLDENADGEKNMQLLEAQVKSIPADKVEAITTNAVKLASAKAMIELIESGKSTEEDILAVLKDYQN